MIPLQQRIASDIAVAAGLPRPQPGRRRPSRSINPLAYDAYLNGMTAKGAQRVDGFNRAVGYFQQAIDIDPDFGEAHAELAMVQLQYVFTGPYSPHVLMPKAEAAAREALRHDAELAVAHWVLGRVLNVYHWRWDEGEKEQRHAKELPGGRNFQLSAELARRGRFDEALIEAERACKLDPLSVQAQLQLGNAYRDAGQHERALKELRRALAMGELPRIHFAIGQTFVAMGRFADAIPELEIAMRSSADHNPRYKAYVGYAYAVAGRTKDARAMLAELEADGRKQYVSSYGVALIHDALEEPELALEACNAPMTTAPLNSPRCGSTRDSRRIASQPRFKTIMKSVGLPE
jgi:tetratricopeptide (TPR) repeat protein